MTLEELQVYVTANTQGLRREMDSVRGQLNRLSAHTRNTTSNMSKAFTALKRTLITLGIGKVIKDSMDATSELEGAMLGLQSIAEAQGRSFSKANRFINEYIQDGLVPLTNATTAYKNLAARGYSDEQIQTVMSRLKDSAAFGRQSSYSLGEAVSTATEGLKNENSVLVDNAGVTKNVAKMWDDYAKSIGKNRNQLTQQEKIQAEVNGIIQETQFQVGDAAKYTETYAGKVAALSKTLRDVKVNLGQAFMPIANIVLPLLQSLANGLLRITSIFGQFTTALFGKTNAAKQAKDTSKQAVAMGDLGDATEKAGKQSKGAIASFDEINTLSKDTGTGESSGAETGEGIDLEDIDKVGDSTIGVSEKVQAMADTIKNAINSIGEFVNRNKEIIISAISGIVAAFTTFHTLTFLSTIPEMIAGIGIALSALLTPIAVVSMVVGALTASFVYLYKTNEDFRNKINAVWASISNTFNSFMNDTLKPIFDYIINGFLVPIGEAFEIYILPVLAELFVGIGEILDDILKLIQSTIDNLWGILKPALELVKKIIIDTLKIIKELWDEYGQEILNNVRKLIQGLQETFQLIWDKIINPIIKPALEMLTWLWDEHLKDLVKQVGEFIMKLVNGALELYNGFIKPIVDWMVTYLGPSVANVVNLLVDLFGSMVAGISDIVKGLFKVLGGIVDFIVGVFTGNWEKAWEGVKEIFGGIFDSLVGLVKVPLNYIIDAINFVIRGLNKISIKTPDWVPGVGGKSFGVNIEQIPKLANGGITDVNNPFLAIVGDNKTQREVVAPLGDLQDMIVSAVGTAILGTSQFNNSNTTVTENQEVVVALDGTKLARILIPKINSETERMGYETILRTT